MSYKLPDELFLQVHKSFIFSVPKIKSVSGNRVFIGDNELPIGELYKLGLKQRVDSSGTQ